MEKIYKTLRNCSIFNGVPEEKYPKLIERFRAKYAVFQKSETILNIGEYTQLVGIVISGEVELSFLDENGNQINVGHIVKDETFGMELACSQGDVSSLQFKAVTDCEILFMDISVLMNSQSPLCQFRMKMTTNLLRDFARQTKFLNQRLRIISQKRLRDRIKICLQSYPMDRDGTIHLPFKRHEWADFLYVDRSALSRELGRMSAEGLIRYRGQDICILDELFLKN